MASMTDIKSGNSYHRSNNGYGVGVPNYSNVYAARSQQGQGYNMPHHQVGELSALNHGFQGMHLQNQTFAAQAKNAMLPTAAGAYGAMPMATSVPGSVYATAGSLVYPNNYGPGTTTQSPSMYTPHAPQYMSHFGYHGYQQLDNSPLSHNWTPTTATNGEVPTLITPRRDSISSNENDLPTTPSYSGYPGAMQAGVAINRSPNGIFAHSTPSSNSVVGPYGIPLSKLQDSSDVSPRIKILVSREPAIPRAIPAPSSPLKPLDRALENQRGETNVYIRGLLPETTDEILEAWGSRFGDIKSSKSIIDLNNGLCKGFGFVKYHNYEDAENCIRGFHYLGYEVSFARESFYSKLKAFADETNTNLYVSNLPKTMNEHELGQLFHPHNVCSSRILRDRSGNGRGVGFARFDSRDVCEEVIKTFNNHTIKSNGDELQIQIRYADTQEQKSLKQQTQAARTFRSAEYEFATQAWRNGRLPYAAPSNQDGNEFERYLGTTPGVPITGQRWAQSALRQGPGRSPLGNGLSYAGIAQTSLAQTDGAVENQDHTHSASDAPAEHKPSVGTGGAAAAISPVDSVTASEHE